MPKSLYAIISAVAWADLDAATAQAGTTKRVMVEGMIDAMAGRESEAATTARRAWARYRRGRK